MLGDKIKKLRKSKNITQEELGKNIGVTTSMVGMYETNARKPSYEVLIKIAEFFSVSTDFLLNTEEKLDMTLDSVKKVYNMVKEATEEYGIEEVNQPEKQENKIKTLAAHFEGEEFTDEDVEDIENFIKFIISKKKK
ncbi:XRE family transcriptional regulator [Clostridium botulinum]|uniref:Transcriptional regulator n=1 Tax=Clostridium botulinum (strain 657 / Type Ba4) TaxID=515621 RepID=A0A3F3ADV4_CLOB6|nr:transcriptional regulator [Clostridium botulinum Ba4 str. 657]APU60199.1 helix-turn-helix family protein [Clostridium botulinum]AWB17227.1 XRE family transcriptional regulator [Clostridium botulinum]AWB30019.1 XRE family transcriptional regulator [Clostridium botulinum]AXG91505.1 XRE family transcriptional regulator [Clostridium botulinum]